MKTTTKTSILVAALAVALALSVAAQPVETVTYPVKQAVECAEDIDTVPGGDGLRHVAFFSNTAPPRTVFLILEQHDSDSVWKTRFTSNGVTHAILVAGEFAAVLAEERARYGLATP